jgi:methionyl-tRNA formyltransferase
MRLALFNLDGVGTNQAILSFLQRHRDEVVYVGLSPPFRAARGGLVRQSVGHMRRSGSDFSNFLGCNFLLPRLVRAVRKRLGLAGGMPPSIAETCAAAGIEVQRVDDVNGAAVIAALSRLKVDLIVSCFFDQIFKRELIAAAPLGVVNVHSALLPQHRGPMPVVQSALDQPSTLGVSIHMVEEGIDTGPILVQEPYQPAAHESILQSITVLHDRGLVLLSDLLPAIAARSVRPLPQSGGSYESFPTRAEIRRLQRQGTPLMNWGDIKRACAMSIET